MFQQDFICRRAGSGSGAQCADLILRVFARNGGKWTCLLTAPGCQVVGRLSEKARGGWFPGFWLKQCCEEWGAGAARSLAHVGACREACISGISMGGCGVSGKRAEDRDRTCSDCHVGARGRRASGCAKGHRETLGHGQVGSRLAQERGSLWTGTRAVT